MHIYIYISKDISAEVSTDILADISADISADMSADISADPFADISADLSADLSAHLSTDISADIFADVYPPGRRPSHEILDVPWPIQTGLADPPISEGRALLITCRVLFLHLFCTFVIVQLCSYRFSLVFLHLSLR